MLSGEGNEHGEKTTIGLISKKATLQVQHTFLYISLPLFCTTYNVKLPGYMFYGGNIVRGLVHFFWLPLIFTLLAASISYFPNRRYKIFMLFFQQKNFPLSFISRSSCLSLFFSLTFALSVAYFPFFSVSLCIPSL